MTDKPEIEVPGLDNQIDAPVEAPDPENMQQQAEIPNPDAPPPVQRPFIAFVFEGPGSAEFQVQRHALVSTMMLSPVKDYLDTLLMGEYATIHIANEQRRQEEAQKAKDAKRGPFSRRLKELAGGKLFKH